MIVGIPTHSRNLEILTRFPSLAAITQFNKTSEETAEHVTTNTRKAQDLKRSMIKSVQDMTTSNQSLKKLFSLTMRATEV